MGEIVHNRGSPDPERASPPRRSEPEHPLTVLQRRAGNAAVAHLVQRQAVAAAPPDPRAVARTDVAAGGLDSMTLGELNQLSRSQADWRSDPDVLALPDQGDAYRRLLVLAQGSQVGAVCEGDSARQLVDAIAADSSFEATLSEYAAAVVRNSWTMAGTTAETIARANAMHELRRSLSQPMIDLVIKQDSANHSLSDLVAANAAAEFSDFVTNSGAILSANNGREVTSFLQLRAEGDPMSFVGRVPGVRNLHHFQQGALEALARNAADTSRSKPLVVVLHAAIDHSGAFHRDPMMTQVAGNRRNNTVIVEGAATLADAGQQATDLTQRYGQGSPPRAEQIMLAGHGNSRVTQLAGTVDPSTAVTTQERVSLDGPHVNETLALINTLLDNLSTDPNARIVLNGCLTASARPGVTITDNPADRAAVLAQLRAALQANRSLADTIRDIAGRRGYQRGQVSAANASFGSEVSLIDTRTGRLGLRSSDDPELTNSDKFAYVRRAGEATGAMRAVVECLATDPTQTETAMRARLGRRRARTPWDDSIIRAFYRAVLARIDDVGFANDLSSLAGELSEAQFRTECKPHRFRNFSDGLLSAAMTPLLNDPELRRSPHLALLMNQVLLRGDVSRAQPFLRAMAGFTVNELRSLLHQPYVQPHLATLLPHPAGRNSGGELRMALFDIARQGTSAASQSIEYVRRLRSGARFANPRLISTALGGAGGGAAGVLETIREPAPVASPPPSGQPAPSGPPVENYNIDLDGDGVNDMYVIPIVKWAITVGRAPVLPNPVLAVAPVATLADSSQVKVIGRTEDQAFYVIEYGPARRPHFVPLDKVLAL